MNETFLIDTHSHVDMIEGLALEEVLKKASDAGLALIRKMLIKFLNLLLRMMNYMGFLGFIRLRLRTGMMG
ncbi:MAG: hypothetical protein KH301_04250 [Brachyspira sp.]|nr:hypothetical protein [Brachyspira sp.]